MTVRVEPRARGRETEPATAGRLSALIAGAGVAITLIAGCGAASTTSVGPSPAKCDISLPASSLSIGPAGGTVSFTVSAQAECAWSAAADVTWISRIAPASGQGSAQVELQALANNGPARSGTLTVGGRAYTVAQTDGCGYTIQPAAQRVGAAATSGSVSVTTASGCAWTASSSDAWLTISSAASGSGSGAVAFSVAANDGPERSATLTVGGRSFALTQASGCSFAISSSAESFGVDGGDGAVIVWAPAACSWEAVTDDPWIMIRGRSGSGNGAVTYLVPYFIGTRSGTLFVAGQAVTVTQGP